MISKPPHSILVELASATEGYAGIPQETRLLLQACWQTPGLEPTGLLYGSRWSVVDHRFASSADAGKCLENHASFFFKITHGSCSSPYRLHRLWRRVRCALRMAFGLRARMQKADNQAHGETIWRLFLEKSLGPTGLQIARHCPMMLANLSSALLKMRAWLHLPTLFLDTRGYDFLLLHGPVPLRVQPETCKLIRYHDLIPALRPELVGSQQQIEAHVRGLRRCDDTVLVCNSEPTRDDLLRHFPEYYDRAAVIPDLLCPEMTADSFPGMLTAICQSRQAKDQPSAMNFRGKNCPPYVILVSSLEPRKNHLQLIRAYEQLTAKHPSELVLIFVGATGWRNDEIHQAMRPLLKQGRLLYLQNVPLKELRVLYTHAEALASPSFYEGFGYSPLEAMQCGTPALASDIPSHRWVYGDAVMYFDPFKVDSLTEALERLLITERESLRRNLIARGKACIARYQIDTVGPQWLSLCDEIRRQGGAKSIRKLQLANWQAKPQELLTKLTIAQNRTA